VECEGCVPPNLRCQPAEDYCKKYGGCPNREIYTHIKAGCKNDVGEFCDPDRGYCNFDELIEIKDADGNVLGRLNPNNIEYFAPDADDSLRYILNDISNDCGLETYVKSKLQEGMKEAFDKMSEEQILFGPATGGIIPRGIIRKGEEKMKIKMSNVKAAVTGNQLRLEFDTTDCHGKPIRATVYKIMLDEMTASEMHVNRNNEPIEIILKAVPVANALGFHVYTHNPIKKKMSLAEIEKALGYKVELIDV
jgi:hypothetical protein